MSCIFSISRLRTNTDGKGITTLVGFNNCPLNCRYCINNINKGCFNKSWEYTEEELLEILSKDEPYYLMTGGGVTFGGGEPLTEAKFIHNICNKINKEWQINIETSLYSKWENIELIAKDIDFWYVDIKEVYPEIYKKYTEKINDKVLRNLKKLIELVGFEKVCIRYPLIPDFNNEYIRNKGIEYLLKNISPKLQIEKFEYTVI